ncbi:MAG: AtpZ/AtpI family protein [Cytophagales bacterium]
MEPKKQPNNFYKYSGLGLQMLVTIGLATFAGIWLDKKLEIKFPVFTLIFLLGSFAGSLYLIYREIN